MIYVCGFLFDPRMRRVVLIRKNRGPNGMAGKLNGVGGKVELGESARGAMAREFLEETGLRTEPWEWMCFHSERYWQDSGNTVHFMCAIREDIDSVVTKEDEKVHVLWMHDDIAALMGRKMLNTMYNLDYLLPMAKVWLSRPKDRFMEV